MRGPSAAYAMPLVDCPAHALAAGPDARGHEQLLQSTRNWPYHQAACYSHLRVHVRLERGGRYALVGANGTGKSTLMRAVADGILPNWPAGLSVKLVSQDADCNEVGDGELTPADALTRADNATAAIRREVARLEEAMSCSDGSDVDADAERLCELYETLEATEAEPEARRRERAVTVLRNLGFRKEGCYKGAGSPPSVDAPAVKHLSGGWRARLRIAEGLLARPELLLLDEPTQHLDLAAVRWLGRHVASTVETCLICAHDIAFVDAFATDIVLFSDQSLTYFHGSWTQMIAAEAGRALAMERAQANLTRRKAAAVASADEMRKVARQSARASSKAKAKEGDAKRLAAAASRMRKVERMGLERTADGKAFHLHNSGGPRLGADCNNDAGWVDGKRTSMPVFVAARDESRMRGFGFAQGETRISGVLSEGSFAESRPSSGVPPPLPWLSPDDAPFEIVLEMRGIRMRYPGAVADVATLAPVLCVRARSRIAVVGKNGCGKSSLLRVLSGAAKPTAGSVICASRVAYVAQGKASALTSEGRTPLDVVAAASGFTELELESQAAHKLRGVLSSFGLRDTGLVTRRACSELSGGQRSRLCMTLASLGDDADVLVLDEPDAHLDVFSIDRLIEALQGYAGAVVLATHNEHLLREVATEWWLFEGGTLSVLTDPRAMGAALDRM